MAGCGVKQMLVKKQGLDMNKNENARSGPSALPKGFAIEADDTAAATRPVPGPILGAREDQTRPLEVPGPLGRAITLASLPPPDTRRWVVRRKAEVIAAIRGGLLTAAEACARYRLSPEELELWQESIDRAGVPGLRVTRIQLYKDYTPPPRPELSRSEAPRQSERSPAHVSDLSRSWGL